MHILNISNVIKKMSINELRGFIFEKYYKRIGFSKGNILFNETSVNKRPTIVCN